MEDQQPAEGDLTTDAAGDPAERETSADPTLADAAGDESSSAAAESNQSVDRDGDVAATEPADGEAEADGDTEADGAAQTAPKGGRVWRKRLARTVVPVAIALVTVLFVGSAAFAGATMQPYLADRATAATKMKVARTAANAITALWTYTPENMDGLADRAAAYLSGDFEAQYRKFVDAIVAPNKQAKITNTTDVTGAAVESLDDPNAVVIVYTNTTSTSPLTKNIPSLKYLSYRIFMKRAKARWLVTRMTTITTLDLTPHP